MAEPNWVREDVVLAIHRRQIAEHGGRDGIRDRGLLQSALARPRHLWSYAKEPPALTELAASYAFGILKNHPFVDGNKRTGYVVCRTFIKINGLDIEASQAEKYTIFIRLAEGSINEAGLTVWLRDHSVK